MDVSIRAVVGSLGLRTVCVEKGFLDNMTYRFFSGFLFYGKN